MISTHILDTSRGSPAEAVDVVLEYREPSKSDWTAIESGKTNSDGRLVFSNAKNAGVYQIRFGTEEYFKRNGVDPFFANVEVGFIIKDTTRKYHVPLLLNPYGYSTYRGS